MVVTEAEVVVTGAEVVVVDGICRGGGHGSRGGGHGNRGGGSVFKGQKPYIVETWIKNPITFCPVISTINRHHLNGITLIN